MKLFIVILFISFTATISVNAQIQKNVHSRVLAMKNGNTYSILVSNITKPTYQEDMAICGENIIDYFLLSKELPTEKIEYKTKLNNTIKVRKAEQSKWAWLNPDKLDLVLVSVLFGCHSQNELVGYVSKLNSKLIKPDNYYSDLISLFFQDKEYNYLFLQIRKPNQKWLDENGNSNNTSIVWISAYYTKDDIIGSQEFWIDYKNSRYRIMSDYWNKKWEGMTLPGYKNWISLANQKSKSKIDILVENIIKFNLK